MATKTTMARSEFEARGLTAEQYLIQVKKYLPQVAAGAKVLQGSGNEVTLEHQPCPKYRVVLRLERPWRASSDYPDQDAANEAWRERYKAAAHYLGLTVDPACSDPNRLFFLPRHAPGAVPDTRIIEGADLQIWDLPGVPQEIPPVDSEPKPEARRENVCSNDQDVIGFFNREFSVETLLANYGYKKIGHKWLAPTSSTKEPGVSVKDGRAFSHHGSDPLFTGDAKHSHDAFSIHRVWGHGGDLKKAVKAAARILNIQPHRSQSGGNGRCADGVWPEGYTREPPEREASQKSTTNHNKKEHTPALNPSPQSEPNELGARVEEMNRKHAVIMLGGKCVVLNEIIDPTFNRPDITFSSPADFKTHYTNRKVLISNGKGETKAVGIGNLWLEHKNRREYEGIVFSPGKDAPGYYNLYRGFAVSPQKGNWSRNRNHIYEIICGSDDQCDAYLMNWMASGVQRAQNQSCIRPGVAVVMRGARGTGKGTFARAYGGIFGSHFLQVTSPNQFIGRFNQHLKDCLVLFADEAFWAGDKTGEGILKALITEPTIRVEPKGKDSFEVRNHVNIIIASNNDWVVPAGIDERRFFVLEVNDGCRQDHAYFKALHDEMNSGGREAMLYDLLNLDITDANLRKVPQTAGLFEQKLLSADSVTKFWFSRLLEGGQLREDADWTSLQKPKSSTMNTSVTPRISRLPGSKMTRSLVAQYESSARESGGRESLRFVRNEYALLNFPVLKSAVTSSSMLLNALFNGRKMLMTRPKLLNGREKTGCPSYF